MAEFSWRGARARLALQVAEDRKMAAHFEACRAVGVDFVPVAVESLGGGGGGGGVERGGYCKH